MKEIDRNLLKGHGELNWKSIVNNNQFSLRDRNFPLDTPTYKGEIVEKRRERRLIRDKSSLPTAADTVLVKTYKEVSTGLLVPYTTGGNWNFGPHCLTDLLKSNCSFHSLSYMKLSETWHRT